MHEKQGLSVGEKERPPPNCSHGGLPPAKDLWSFIHQVSIQLSLYSPLSGEWYIC